MEKLELRIKEHPILEIKEKEEIRFMFNGNEVVGYEGDTIASALVALGVKEFSKSLHHHRSRGFYCAIGNCSSCRMLVDGVPNVKTCITPLKPNMVVWTQEDKGVLK